MVKDRIVYPLQSWLQQKMDERQWSQADLARALGIDKTQISRWFTTRKPNPESCLMIAEYFGEDPYEIFRLVGYVKAVKETPDAQRDRVRRKLNLVDLEAGDRIRTLEDLVDAWLARDRQGAKE